MLQFPSDAGDEDIAAGLQRLYASTPAQSPADAARCAARVLQAAAAAPGGRHIGMPRQRWWWGAAAAAVLVTVTMRPWQVTDSARAGAFAEAARLATPTGSVTPLAGGDGVRFNLTLPAGATDVALVGDFNGWDERATPMVRRNTQGTWTAQVELPPGRHVYAFVVDGGRWLVDPMAPQVPDAGFGPANAVVIEGAR